MRDFKATDEQLNIVDAARKILKGENKNKGLKAIAFAGAGKTSTMTMIGEDLCSSGYKGMYLAFNKDIATEAKSKMPPGVDARTFHSLAYAHTHPAIKSKLNNRKGFFPKNFAVDFKVVDFGIRGDTRKSKVKGKVNDSIWMSNYRQYIVIKAAMDNFLLDMTDKPEKYHIINSCERVLKAYIDDDNKEMLAGRLISSLRKLWDSFQDINNEYAINPNVYLKLWALTRPVIDVDFILFDEAQDSDKLMLDVLSRQKAKIIYVGDPHQQIYEWRGAVNAMNSIDMQSYYLTQSFRFGTEIADYAGHLLISLLGETKKMSGLADKEGLVDTTQDFPTDINAILCRTNIGAIEAMLDYAINTSKRVVPSNIDIRDTVQLLHDIEMFKNNDPNLDLKRHFILNNFSDFKELQEFCEQATFDTVIAPTFSLYNEYGYEKICEILNSVGNNQNKEDVIIATTAHKSKGLEWDGVLIWDDFNYVMRKTEMTEYLEGKRPALTKPPINKSEARLLYVTMTRAKRRLYSHHVDILVRYLDMVEAGEKDEE